MVINRIVLTIILVAGLYGAAHPCPLQINNDGTSTIYFEDAEQHKSMLFPPGVSGPIIDPLYAKSGPVTFFVYVQDPATQEYQLQYKVHEQFCADGPLIINFSSILGQNLGQNDRFLITQEPPK